MASHRRRQQPGDARNMDAVASGSSDDMIGGVRDLVGASSGQGESSDRTDRNEYH
jgi:hypothetical protein